MNLSLIKTTLFFIALILFLLGPSHNSFAESTINCHCFKERTFNPNDTFSTDDYILATSFNSLLAKSYDIPKRQVITLKMKEKVGHDDLLIGFKISKSTGVHLKQLLSFLERKKTWSKVLSEMDQQEMIMNDQLLEAIKSGLPVDEAGDRAGEELISEFYSVPAEKIGKLRKSGLNEKEMALLFILVHAKDQKLEVLVKQHNGQGKSWSEIAHNLGVEPAAAGKLILAYPAKQIAE
jgi:hypothetical protein